MPQMTSKKTNAFNTATRVWYSLILAHLIYMAIILNHDRFTPFRPNPDTADQTAAIYVNVAVSLLGAIGVRRALQRLSFEQISAKPKTTDAVFLQTLAGFALSCLIGIPGMVLSLTGVSQEIATILWLSGFVAHLIQKPKERTFEASREDTPCQAGAT